MKKTAFSLLIAIPVLLFSCTKQVAPAPSAGWYVGSTAYYAYSIQRVNGDKEIALNGVNELEISFDTLPTVNDTTYKYKITDGLKADSFTLAPTECGIRIVTAPFADQYISLGSNADSVYVIVTGNKYNIEVPYVGFLHLTNTGTFIDSTSTGGYGGIQE